jgi:hypothetical protein
MPSKPSRADQELARQATEAGWPTSADQVRELHERKVLPEKVVVRRGHGITESKYPKGALNVLVAVRREMAKPGRSMIRRAVPFAWVNGANVRSEALLDGLLRMVDDLSRPPRRAHRRNDPGADGMIETLVPDRRDRQEMLQAFAAIMAGEEPPPGRVRSAAAHAIDVVRRTLPALASGGNTPVPLGASERVAAAMVGKPSFGDSAMDLHVTALRATLAYLLPARRKTLDRLRDQLRAQFAGRMGDDELLGMIVGQAQQLLTEHRYGR